MKINLAGWDRTFRLLLGVLLFAWAIAGGPWWGYLGIYFIFSSAWGYCPIYTLLKIKSYDASSRPFLPPE